MFPVDVIVVSSVTAVVLLLALIVLLGWKLYLVKRRSHQDMDFLQDRVLIFPPTGGQKERIPNRMVQILQINKRMSQDYPGNPEEDFPHRELLSVPIACNKSSSGSETSLFRSSPDSSNEADDEKQGKASGEQTSSDDNQGKGQEGDGKEVPTIEMTINYFSSTGSLALVILRIRNLPVQFRKHCASYVKVSLKAFTKLKTRRQKTKTVRNSLNPEYQEQVSFVGYSFQELRNYRLRISCFAKSRKLSKKILVGDLFLPLARPDFEPDTLLDCKERLSLACPITGKRGPLVLAGELGFLQIEMHFSPDSHRLKIMLRKGQHLPANKVANFASLGSPEFYVILSLMYKGEAINYKESRPAFGTNPTFNQPFLFYLDNGQPEEYWVQFLVMRGKFYTRDGAVGQVLVGNETSLGGKAHWDQVLESGNPEVTKWHEVTSIGTGCF